MSQGNERTFSVWQLFSFGVLTAPLAMAGLALTMYIPTYYAVDLGLGLTLVGAIFVFGRLVDIMTDPVIGFLSDKTISNFGARLPWMLGGFIGFSAAVWLLFYPPPQPTIIYLIVASGLYFLFYTILDVPYSAIGVEISPHVHERSILASSKAIFQVIGAIAAASVPFVFAVPVSTALEFIAQAIWLLLIVGLLLFILFVPKQKNAVVPSKTGAKNALRILWKNRPYRFLIGCFFIIQAANSLTAGLMVLFVSKIIGSAELIGLFLGVLLLSSAVFLPLWVFLSKRYSKKSSWSVSIITCIIMLLFVPMLGNGDAIGMAIFCVIIGAALGCDAIMPTSILADLIHRNEQDGNMRSGGLFLAVKNSVSKLSFVVPMGLAFPVLGYIGFEKTGGSTASSQLVFMFFYVALPAALRLVALYFLRKAPLVEPEETSIAKISPEKVAVT